MENKISEENLRELMNITDKLNNEKDINERLKTAFYLSNAPGPYMKINYRFGVNCYNKDGIGNGYAYIYDPSGLKPKLPYFIPSWIIPECILENYEEEIRKSWNPEGRREKYKAMIDGVDTVLGNMFAMETASNKPIEEIIEEIEGYHDLPIPRGRFYLGPKSVIEPDPHQYNYKCCKEAEVWVDITINTTKKDLEKYKEFIEPYKKEIKKIEDNRKKMLSEIEKNAQEMLGLLKSAKITEYKVEYPMMYMEGKPTSKIFGLRLPSLRKRRVLEVKPEVREIEIKYHKKLDSNEIESIINFLKPIAEKYEFKKVMQTSFENK